MRSQPVIFTDLDGTLLDAKTYAFTAALPALELVKAEGIPLVFCTSKTRVEIEHWRARLENPHPFISENGGAVFVPPSYFQVEDIGAVWSRRETVAGYSVLVLGTPYVLLRKALEELRVMGFDVRGFGDMDAQEVSEITGLRLEEANLAKRREFDEPFVYSGDPAGFGALLDSLREKGLRYAKGRLCHLTGDNDKGKAVEILRGLYERKFGSVFTIALGDSPVDFPMLEKVDYPVLVRNHKGEHEPGIVLPSLLRTDEIGPEGWNKALLDLIQNRM